MERNIIGNLEREIFWFVRIVYIIGGWAGGLF